jgi:hypothetical protein
MDVPTFDCAICAGRTLEATQPLALGYGVTISVCAEHGSPEYQRLHDGRELVRALERIWAANGCLTSARSKALQAHARALRPSEARSRPGSYTWAGLRHEAERLFAAGEPARPTIDRLRRAVSVEGARPPSVRTMMRWHSDRRWLTAGHA